MNYARIYEEIVQRALERDWSKGYSECNYIEIHHIIPKSMGGSNDKSNLVALTAREHFISHWLLYNIHKNRQMAYAWNAMCIPNGNSRYTSRNFQKARECFSLNVTGPNHPSYGVKRSDETRLKQSIAKKEYLKSNPEALNTLRTRSIGYKHSEASIQKIRSAGIGRVHSEESKSLMKHKVRESVGVSVVSTDSSGVETFYEVMQDAVDEGFTASNISHCCRGRRPLHKGRSWRYADKA